MTKKEDFIGFRISRELKTSLEKKAKAKGVSLSRLIEENLNDTYKSDKEHITALIAQKEQERPVYWEELYKSPIAKEFRDYVGTIFTEFSNPISRNPQHQPVILLLWINHILQATIKHFDTVPDEYKREAADKFLAIGETLVNGLSNIKAVDSETEEHIINLKKAFVEKACHHFTSLAFAKDSYKTIRAELEKVSNELLNELKVEIA